MIRVLNEINGRGGRRDGFKRRCRVGVKSIYSRNEKGFLVF